MSSPPLTSRSIAMVLVVAAACGIFAYYRFQPRVAPALFVDKQQTAPAFSQRPVVIGSAPPARFSAPIGFGARLEEVVDGNTLRVIGNNNRQSLVRLADVDAPALSQPYGVQARDELEHVTSNATLQIVSGGVTANGMEYAHILANGVDVAGALLRAGAARVATASSSSPPPDLMAFENEARAAQRGLWALPARDRMRPCWSRGDC